MAALIDVPLRQHPASSRSARNAAERVLADVCSDEQVGDVLTVISELVTNAVRHTNGSIAFALHREGDQLVVEVRDTDTRAPHSHREIGDLGHGLGVVQSLATRWGIDRMDGGKCVWAEFTIEPAAIEPAARQLDVANGAIAATSRSSSPSTL